MKIGHHLNWRGIAVLGLLVAALMVGLYLGTKQVADVASRQAVKSADAKLRGEFYDRDVAVTGRLQVGCAGTTEFKRYMIEFLRDAAAAWRAQHTEQGQRTAAAYDAIRAGMIRTLPTGTTATLGDPTTCAARYPLPAPQ